MITAGIDVGAQRVKVVILGDVSLRENTASIPKGDRGSEADGTGAVGLLAWASGSCGIDRRRAAEQALEEALRRAGLTRAELERTFSTGTGRKDVPFADEDVTEVIADARGAAWLLPAARTVIDIGAEESRAIKCEADGKVIDFAKNEKCAAGVGGFVESMARALEVGLEQMGELSLLSQQEIPMNVTCVVFAESEVVSLIHSRVAKADIARAIHEAIATRTTAMVRKVGIDPEVALIGGVARNVGVMACLKKHLGVELRVPEEPELAGALGAALLAQEA